MKNILPFIATLLFFAGCHKSGSGSSTTSVPANITKSRKWAGTFNKQIQGNTTHGAAAYNFSITDSVFAIVNNNGILSIPMLNPWIPVSQSLKFDSTNSSTNVVVYDTLNQFYIVHYSLTYYAAQDSISVSYSGFEPSEIAAWDDPYEIAITLNSGK